MKSEPPPFTRHQFGTSGGGPIAKNRLFFFGGVERLQEDLGITSTVFGQLQYALNRVWRVKAAPHAALIVSFIKQRILSFALVLSVGFLLMVSLIIGMTGYHWLAPMGWLDAFVNAAMLLGGMGPVSPLGNDEVKMFAGVYALYCGVVFIATAGLVLAPVGAHILHRFHLDKQ